MKKIDNDAVIARRRARQRAFAAQRRADARDTVAILTRRLAEAEDRERALHSAIRRTCSREDALRIFALAGERRA
jgi:hypothetical protein